MALEILGRDIEKLLGDIRSDKVTVRTKALESLQHIFEGRSRDFTELLSTELYCGVTWKDLLRSLHEAVKAQADRLDDPRCTTATKNHSGAYLTTLMKYLDLANDQTQNIAYDAIFEIVFEAFAGAATRKHFDHWYVQIIRKHVLKSHRTLATVEISHWHKLLSCLFQLFEQSDKAKTDLLECYPLLVQCGVKYTNLASDLSKYLPNVENIVHQEHQIKAQHHVVVTVYEFVKNLAANHRIRICKFTEEVLSSLIKIKVNHIYRMSDDTKLELFKILHLSIVVHHPRVGNNEMAALNAVTAGSVPAINYVHDIQMWHKQLRSMFHIVDGEIKENGKGVRRSQLSPKLCSTFVAMAADLCAVVFWDDSVWVLPTDEPETKKRCELSKLERFADLIERSDYTWQWATILSKLLADHPNLIHAKDFHPLLQMLSGLQSKMKYSDQGKVFNELVRILLIEEKRLKITISGTSVDHLHKIMQIALKNCATSNEAAEQNVELCRIFIESGYIVSYAFIETIVKEISSNTIKKSTASVRLLVTILQNVNMDLLTSANDMKASVINWLSPRAAASELKQLIGNEMDIDITLIAELYVLCVLSKTDKSSKLSFEHKQPIEPHEATFEAIIGDLKRQFSYQIFDGLLAIDCDREIDRVTEAEARFDLPVANSIYVVLNENLYSELEKSLNPDDIFQPTANFMDDFAIIASSLTTYINILNQFLAYNAFDTATLERSFLYKRIAIKIGQLNSMIGGLMHCDDKDQFDVVKKIDLIWKFGLHPLLEQLVFRQECNIQLIEWLALQLQPKLPCCSQPLKRISLAELSTARKMQLKCLILVARFSTLDDENGNKALQVLENFESDTSCNANLFIMFELAQIILGRKSPEKTVQYVLEFFMEVCKDLFNHPPFLAQIIENIPALTEAVQTSEPMQDNLLQIVNGLIKLTKTKLSPQLTARLVSTLKYVAKDPPSDPKFVETFLTHFAKFNDIRVQLEAIECLAHIFNHKWIHGQDTGTQLADIHQQLYDAIYSNLPGISPADDMDKKSANLAIRVQFHCSIIANCFCLRKENWFHLFELCCINLEICKDLIEKVVTKICEHFFKALPVYTLRSTIPYLIARWIESNHTIDLIPWYFTCSKTYNDFLLDHVESIAVAILRYAPDRHQRFEQTWHFETLELMLRQHESILINCLAYITPLKVITGNQSPDSGYETSAMRLTAILMEIIPNCSQYFKSHSLEIVEQMLANTWDMAHFESLFDTRINYIAEKHAITHKMFTDSIVYIQDEYNDRSNIFETNFAAEPHRMVNLLYSLKLKLQEAIFPEEKMLLLYQICVLVELISHLLCSVNDRYRNSVEFFVRDLLYFFGNLINTSDKVPQLKLATCKYFLRFCKRILPAVAEYFRPHLNFVVSVLVPIIKKNNHESLTVCAMELLTFLIVDQEKELRDAIAVLDRFPSQTIFTELCRVQNSVKYGDREFSLAEEIEYFLSIEKRKIEGLIALKEQLSTKKTELQQLFQRIYDVHGFSEDCEKSVIHRLINSLLQIVQGVDSEKAMTAARCLGELGPSDLGTIVLKSDNDSKIYRLCTDFNEAAIVLYQTSLEMLNRLLLHTDARVLRAVANACIHLLKTNIGRNNTDGRSHLDVFNMDGHAESLITLPEPDNAVVLLPLFETDGQFTHTVWIKKFTILLLQQFGDKYLSEVASMQALFAEAILPPLIKILLSVNTTQNNIQLGASVRMFFEKHFNSCEAIGPMDINQIFRNKMIIKTMLKVAECIRIHNLNVRDRKIHLNYLHIAKAANYCDAHFTAILYGEMARLKHFDGVDYECDDSKTKKIMKESYQSIGEIDAVSAFIDPIENRSEYLHQKKSWDELCLRQDAISTTQPANTSAYARTMCDSGLYKSAQAHVLAQKTNEINYECAWRLGDWSVVDRESDRGQHKPNVIFDDCEKFHYFALKCLNGRDESGVKVNIEKARNQIIRRIKLSSYECTRNIYKNLASFHLLQQIEDFCDIQFNVGDASVEMMIKKWNDQDTITPSDFIYREPILAQRIRLFESAGIRAKRKIEEICKDIIPARTLQVVSECRKGDHLHLATRHLATISKESLTKDMTAKYHIEDAKLNWALGDPLLAKKLIEFVSSKKDAILPYLTSQRILGQYLAEIRSEETKKIIEMQEKSLKILKKIKTEEIHAFHVQHKLKTHHLIAKYADREYQQVADHRKSPAYEKKTANVNKNKIRLAEMVERANSGEKETKEEHASKIFLTNSINIDVHEMKATDNDYDYYLEYAIKSYLKCIILETDRYSSSGSHMFRVFSLWLANKSNPIANDTLEKYIEKVPSHKFIALMPQITPHLSSNNDETKFSEIIARIVERCAIDHPYHVLPQIFALANANHEIESLNVVKSPRTVAAEALILKLGNQNNLCQVIEQMRKMNDILIELAYKKLDTENLSENEPLCKLKDLHLVHCPTVKLPISTDAEYPSNRLTTIFKWTTDLKMPGGINLPKRIKCICSNGQAYLQLLKSRDDLRQDAVMQQVFNMMNDMLSHSKTTRKLRLNVRTYVVVPLSQRSGILEWCENTIALKEYLVGSQNKPGAHQRYFPKDDLPIRCLRRLKAIGDAKRNGKLTADTVLTEFNEICEKINPVLHYFFYEKFYSPGVWFERRLAYAHSLATTSMIGYILGIGDRHVDNILIDQKTAELIHIDFGVAFDQGKCLPTPETIPFRLTRDLTKALGSTGIEGVFRKSCEKTMEALRANKTTIITIIEVLLHDPLYLWSLTNKKAQEVQNPSDHVVDEVQDINGMAERALLRLEEKLNGKHSSRSEANSVPCHVEILIKEATNPHNLSQLFFGWQAYL